MACKMFEIKSYLRRAPYLYPVRNGKGNTAIKGGCQPFLGLNSALLHQMGGWQLQKMKAIVSNNC